MEGREGQRLTDERTRLKAAIDREVARLVALADTSWPVRADHCFLRIAYDGATGARWDKVVRRPAWRHLPLPVLAEAHRLLVEMRYQGPSHAAALNRASLAFRGNARDDAPRLSL